MLKERISHFQAKVDTLHVEQAEAHERFKAGRMKKTEFNARTEQYRNTVDVYEAKIKKLRANLPVEVKCTKCGKMAMKAIQVRDEEGILLAVKYHHEMIPTAGYEWICTQTMEYQPIHDYKGSIKKEMAKRPYAFKQKGSMSNLDRITPDHYRRVGN